MAKLADKTKTAGNELSNKRVVQTFFKIVPYTYICLQNLVRNKNHAQVLRAELEIAPNLAREYQERGSLKGVDFLPPRFRLIRESAREVLEYIIRQQLRGEKCTAKDFCDERHSALKGKGRRSRLQVQDEQYRRELEGEEKDETSAYWENGIRSMEDGR